MIIKVLAENISENENLGSEHGLSLYIETEKHKILFDTGASGLFSENAAKLNVDLADIDIAVISHGHYDHGGGLDTFLALNSKAKVYIQEKAFGEYYGYDQNHDLEYIGLDVALKQSDRFVLLSGTYLIDNELKLLSGVKGRRFFPSSNSNLLMKSGNGYIKDDFSHEQNLIINANDKKVLITGCAHNGIVNIIEHFRAEEGVMPDFVIGGFHLSNPDTKEMEDPQILSKIAEFFLDTKATYYTCHCTGQRSYEVLKGRLDESIFYFSVGGQLIV